MLNQNTGLWDADYFNASGSQQLTQLVEQLLKDGTQRARSLTGMPNMKKLMTIVAALACLTLWDA